MKYNSVKVVSHPRSGSHWVMRLIDLNFFDGKNYLKHYGGHPFGHEMRARGYFKRNQAVIYTCRNLDNTAKSIFRMRHRFGLNEDDYEKFLITPMRKMYNNKLKFEAIRDTLTDKIEVTEVDWLFRNRNETVKEYIQKHIDSWSMHVGKPNFIVLPYSSLVNGFENSMLAIAQFLGSNKTKFIDEQKRIGWREKQDNAWTKPGNNSSQK
jgi:hypothetical protein